MSLSFRKTLLPVLAASLLAMAAVTQPKAAGHVDELILASEAGRFRAVEFAVDLDTPWSLAFLPDGRMLVTERPGNMRIVSQDGRLSAPLQGVPEVHAVGQGGLLDVVLGPDFDTDRRIYFSYAEPTRSGARTAVARAVLDPDGERLTDVERIFVQSDDPRGGYHFGSRLVFGDDGALFVTLGDRNTSRERAQHLDTHLGKIVRINADGSVPEDNPFVDRAGALPEIWSLGHRNVQGAALHPETRELWTHEHGPRGGDEVNLIRRGANYGWPEITHGREYVTRRPIGEGTERENVEPPIHYWVPVSIAPSGMAFYTGEAFPDWQGSLFIGALRDRMLVRLALDGEEVVHEEALLKELRSRIRDVRQGPDGLLYVLDETHGHILRFEPK